MEPSAVKYLVMKFFLTFFLVHLVVVLKAQDVKALHVLNYTNDELLDSLSENLEGLSEKGINTIFLEVDYHFDFKSHPELRQTDNVITKKSATKFAKEAEGYGIEIIPQFQCLGHQSWDSSTWKLLTVYPELDLTPGAFPNNDSIYCREWDVMNPMVNEIVFPMIDEITEAFNAKGVHLGMDEVFLLGHPKSLSTKGMDPAFLYGKVIREFHEYFTNNKGKQLYIWGDRFIDGNKYAYGQWEASENGTWPAIDSVPKDIIICDWHYEVQKEYPSVDLFLDKGFRVLPSSWKNIDATKTFIAYSYAKKDSNMLGHMFTTWGETTNKSLLGFGSMNLGLLKINEGRFHEVFISSNGVDENGALIVELKTSADSIKIAYSLDGEDPHPDSNLYSVPFVYPKGVDLKAVPVLNGKYAGEISSADFLVHLGMGKKVSIITKPSDKYAVELKGEVLTNAIGFTKEYSDGEWLAFEGNDAEFIIDLEDEVIIKKVSMNFHNKVNDWIHHSNDVTLLGSLDGKSFSVLGAKKIEDIDRPIVNVAIDLAFDNPLSKARYIKVVAKNQIIPFGFSGEGNPAWLFIDEVVVE